MGTRRKAREAALQMLCLIDASEQPVEQGIAHYWEHLAQADANRDFADELVRGCRDHLAEIDETIRSASRHWRLERMARVDRNTIRLATHELLHRADIPARVTLNEAIEIAKRFGDEQSPAFVNGLLDRIAAETRKG